MKVALLSDCYLPRLGGIEVQTHDLAQHLVGLGHDVEVFTATAGEAGERHGAVTDVDGIPVHRLATRMPWDLPVNPFAPPELRRRLVAGGFDVAHVQTGVVSPFAWDCTRVALGIGLPLAMTWHCMLDRAALGFRATGVVRRWASRGVAMSAVSGVAAEPLRRLAGPGASVSVLPNGIDVSRWQAPAPTPTPTPSSDRSVHRPLRLVTAMRLARRKRPRALVELAVAAERLAGPGSLELTILGEGPDRGAVESYLREHRIGWVALPGRVSREELKQRYAAADVYVSPSLLESFGIAALEARTVGLPVIGRAGSGVGEFVKDGVNGLVVQSDSDMAAAIARLAHAPEEVARMRTHNVEHPPAQDWPAVAALAVAEYDRAVSLASRSRQP